MTRRTAVTRMLAVLGAGSLAGLARTAGAQNGSVQAEYNGDIHVESTNQATQAAEAGCNEASGPSGGKCTTTFGGKAEMSPRIGKVRYTSSFTSDWSQYFQNDDGDLCAPVTGTVKLVKRKRGAITMTVDDDVCQSNPTTGYPLEFDGTYEVTGGRGAFKGAKGTGTASGSVDGAGEGAAAFFEADGQIKY